MHTHNKIYIAPIPLSVDIVLECIFMIGILVESNEFHMLTRLTQAFGTYWNSLRVDYRFLYIEIKSYLVDVLSVRLTERTIKGSRH